MSQEPSYLGDSDWAVAYEPNKSAVVSQPVWDISCSEDWTSGFATADQEQLTLSAADFAFDPRIADEIGSQLGSSNENGRS